MVRTTTGYWACAAVALLGPASPAQWTDVWRSAQRVTARAAEQTHAAASAVAERVEVAVRQLAAGADPRVVAYFTAKRSADTASAGRPWRTLSDDLKARLEPLFRRLDLDRVRFRDGARTPATRWQPGGASMTFGNDLYFGPEMPQDVLDRFARGESKRGASLFRLLVHELTHADQVRRLGGESAFARAYLDAWLLAGMCYEDNSFEREAFGKQDGWLPPAPEPPRPRR